MAMNTEEQQEYREAVALMSADELRAQLGDDPDQDAIINAQLASGKAIEMKTRPELDDEHPNPDDKRVEPAPKGNAGDDDDDLELDPDGQPLIAEAGAPTLAPTPAPELPPLDLKFLDAEYGDKLGALNTEKAAQFAKLMEGEISAEDYAQFEAKYFDQREALRTEKAAAGDYYTTIHAFKAQALANSGINYDADPAKAQAWDDWVKRLAANPAHAKLSDAELLDLAHKKVMLEFDVTPKSGQNAGQTVANGKKVAQTNGRAPNLAEIPPTLGGIPAAAGLNGADGGEFAHLERLSGMEFETALARMSEDQRDRYARG